MILELILFLILGFSIGSFLNMLVYRLPKGQFIFGRSYCDNCRKTLLWYDLIPLFSFIILSGKCRFCKKKINNQAPLVETLTALLFVCLLLKYPILTDLNLWFFLFFVSSLITIFFIDLNDGIIPNKITFPLFFISLIYVTLNPNLFNHILSSFFIFLLFLMIYLLTKGRGIGFGDVKLVLVIGLVFGFPKIIITSYLAFLTGAIVSLILILWGKKHLHKDTIPFGPFLVIGAIVGIFLGDSLVSLLLSFWW